LYLQSVNHQTKLFLNIYIIYYIILGTIPSGDINLEYNSNTPLEILCILNPDHDLLQKMVSDDAADSNKSKLPSHRIRFYKNDERVAQKYITIINSTAAQLRVSNPPASFDVYSCMLCLDENDNSVDKSKTSDISSINMVLRNSINTIGYHPKDSHDSDIGVCLNNVFVGCEFIIFVM